MASLRGNKNSAIALFVDGLELKLAKLSIKKGNIVLDALQSATLAAKLEERQVADLSSETITESADAFALPADAGSETAGDNNSVLLSLLSKYPTQSYIFCYAVAETSMYYHT